MLIDAAIHNTWTLQKKKVDRAMENFLRNTDTMEWIISFSLLLAKLDVDAKLKNANLQFELSVKSVTVDSALIVLQQLMRHTKQNTWIKFFVLENEFFICFVEVKHLFK